MGGARHLQPLARKKGRNHARPVPRARAPRRAHGARRRLDYRQGTHARRPPLPEPPAVHRAGRALGEVRLRGPARDVLRGQVLYLLHGARRHAVRPGQHQGRMRYLKGPRDRRGAPPHHAVQRQGDGALPGARQRQDNRHPHRAHRRAAGQDSHSPVRRNGGVVGPLLLGEVAREPRRPRHQPPALRARPRRGGLRADKDQGRLAHVLFLHTELLRRRRAGLRHRGAPP